MIVCWVGVMAIGVWLRFDGLSSRPFHCDEATGARITARRMESGNSQFDPQHFHGPLLSSLAMPLCRARGETCWQELTKGSLRLVPAIAGCLLVLLPLGWRRRWGDAPMLLAAALLATSPLLVYYSRMFIHESVFGLLGMLALMVVLTKPKWGLPGVCIGLMFATRETFVISVIAWLGAAGLVALGRREWLTRNALTAGWRMWRLPLVISMVSAALTAGFFYSDGLRHPAGVWDAVQTFFVYKTGAGHDKPFFYYLNFLTIPHKAGGLWWYGTPVVALALLAFLTTMRRSAMAGPQRATIRFIAYAAAGHFLIYSLIAYKSPWLACLPWAHVCLLAGFALADLPARRPALQAVLAVLALGCLASQYVQARRATGRYASDERNPIAFVPTRPDVEKLAAWLEQLRGVAPGGTLEPIAVVGGDYWPLPWYLRPFGQVGYWPDLPRDGAKLPLVIAMPD